MSNTVITLLVVFAFAAGLGLGLVTVLRPRAPSLEQKLAERQRRDHTRSEVYFGRDDDNDHPDDIERQGSLFPQRAAAHRYDGMADGDAPYVPSGLDFADRPR
jgi:hypothetical protein